MSDRHAFRVTRRRFGMPVLPVALVAALALVPSAGVAERLSSSQHEIELTPVLQGLELPWSLAFLPDGRWLVTERPGRLRVVEGGRLLPEPVGGMPPVFSGGQGGLLDVSPHPDFAENSRVYWSYSAPADGGARTEVARGRLSCAADVCRIEDVEVLFRQSPALPTDRHFGSRLVWDAEGNLYVTLGDRGTEELAQDRDNHIGAVLRITEEGGVPADNPFVGQAGVRPEIWTWGNRNVQGAALHPVTGELWAHEHGPRGGDEVNVLRPGENYGWPRITYGRTYMLNLPIGEGTEAPDVTPPRKVWIPSIGPSGMSFYTGSAFPQWQGDLFVGALAGEALVRLSLQDGEVVGEERLGGMGRVRDVRQGPDGLLYVVSESEGTVFSLRPAP